jgi:hypothetical protein
MCGAAIGAMPIGPLGPIIIAMGTIPAIPGTLGMNPSLIMGGCGPRPAAAAAAAG